MNFKHIIEETYNYVKPIEDIGQLACYIPELANVDANKFGIYVSSINHKSYGIGDCFDKFSIQSIAKVLSLSLAYNIVGEKIWERLDVEPSGTPFNSLVQLEVEKGKISD